MDLFRTTPQRCLPRVASTVIGRNLRLNYKQLSIAIALTLFVSVDSIAVGQKPMNSDFFSPIGVGRNINERKLSDIIAEFSKAHTRADGHRYSSLYGCFDEIRRVAESQAVDPKDSLAARVALGNVNDTRATEMLIAIAQNDALPVSFRVDANKGLQKHALRGTVLAGEYFAAAESDDKAPEELRQSTSAFLARIGGDMPKPVQAMLIKAKNDVTARRSWAVENTRLRKQLFSMIEQQVDRFGASSTSDVSEIPMAVIIAHFVEAQLPHLHVSAANAISGRDLSYIRRDSASYAGRADFKFVGDDLAYDMYLRSDAAFDAIRTIASSNGIEPTTSLAARAALGKVRDERAVRMLIAIATDAGLPDNIRVSAHEELQEHVRWRSEVATIYLADSAADKTLPELMQASTASFIDGIGKGVSIPQLNLLARSKSELIREKAVAELDRLKTLDARLSAQDVYELERFKAEAVRLLEFYIEEDEGRIAELRKMPTVKKVTSIGQYTPKDLANAIDQLKKTTLQKRKSLADYQKRPVFDLAVDELAAYCEALDKTEGFVEMSAEALNKDMDAKIALADAMPVVRWQETLVDGRGNEIPETTTNHEVDLAVVVGILSMFEWQARIDAKEQARQAECIRQKLMVLSDDGLRQVKIAYLDRLASTKGRKGKK